MGIEMWKLREREESKIIGFTWDIKLKVPNKQDKKTKNSQTLTAVQWLLKGKGGGGELDNGKRGSNIR